jgi:hypothetical protein
VLEDNFGSITVKHSPYGIANVLSLNGAKHRSFRWFHQKEYLNTKAQLWRFLINKIVSVTPLNNNTWKKAEIFSFPTVPGSGGRRQSLHGKIIDAVLTFEIVQWASRKKGYRMILIFTKVVWDTSPKLSVQPVSPPRHNHGDQRIVLVNMGSFLWPPATLRSRLALNISRDWLGQLGCRGIIMEGPQKSFLISTS